MPPSPGRLTVMAASLTTMVVVASTVSCAARSRASPLPLTSLKPALRSSSSFSLKVQVMVFSARTQFPTSSTLPSWIADMGEDAGNSRFVKSAPRSIVVALPACASLPASQEYVSLAMS